MKNTSSKKIIKWESRFKLGLGSLQIIYLLVYIELTREGPERGQNLHCTKCYENMYKT